MNQTIHSTNEHPSVCTRCQATILDHKRVTCAAHPVKHLMVDCPYELLVGNEISGFTNQLPERAVLCCTARNTLANGKTRNHTHAHRRTYCR